MFAASILVGLVVMQAGPALEFEVASIKLVPTRPDELRLIDRGTGGPGSEDPTTFRCSNCIFAGLLERAFDLKRYQFVPSPWMTENEYQVAVRVPAGTTQQQFRLMMQHLLEERFTLKHHFEKTEVEGYELSASKTGIKLRESSTTDTLESTLAKESRILLDKNGYPVLEHPGMIGANGRVHLKANHKSSAEIARLISDFLAIPVADGVDLKGFYDLDLFYVVTRKRIVDAGEPERMMATETDSGPGFVSALQSELGLKLVPKKVPVDMFVVDRVQKIPTAN